MLLAHVNWFRIKNVLVLSPLKEFFYFIDVIQPFHHIKLVLRPCNIDVWLLTQKIAFSLLAKRLGIDVQCLEQPLLFLIGK